MHESWFADQECKLTHGYIVIIVIIVRNYGRTSLLKKLCKENGPASLIAFYTAH